MSSSSAVEPVYFLIFLFVFFVVIIGVVVIAIWFVFKEDDSFKIHFSARRLKLRDKGAIERFGEGRTLLHTFCQTRVRVGITTKGGFVRYCWRCEQILDGSDPDDDPKGKEPAPEETSHNVVQLFRT